VLTPGDRHAGSIGECKANVKIEQQSTSRVKRLFVKKMEGLGPDPIKFAVCPATSLNYSGVLKRL
jgi:hypothetical protein